MALAAFESSPIKMDPKKAPQFTSVARRLAGANLQAHEWELLSSVLGHSLECRAGHDIEKKDTKPSRCRLVLMGFVGMARTLADGRRQMVDIHLPGDITACERLGGAQANVAFVCLTDVRYIDVDSIAQMVDDEPTLFPGWQKFLKDLEEEAHVRLIDQVVRTGRMVAHERMADLALDLFHRFERVGMTASGSFPMPLTQDVLGDILGMSTVHVNRTLQQLRREGLIRTTSNRWQIVDMERLRHVAGGNQSRPGGTTTH